MPDNTKRNAADEIDSRRTFLKRTAAVSGVTLTGLAGCSTDSQRGAGASPSGTGTDGGGSNISTGHRAFGTVVNMQNDIWRAFADGMKEAANALNLDKTAWQQHKGQQQKQLSQLDTAFTRDFDIITGTTFQNSGIPSVARKCVQNNAAFIDFWSMAKWFTPLDAGPEFVQYQIPEVYKTGQLQAEVLFEAMGGSGNFVHITGPRGAVGWNRNKGVQRAMEKYPDINRLGQAIPGDWTRPSGRQVMSDFVSKFGDEIDGVYAQNDGMGLGAFTVLSNNDMNVPLTGYDGPQEAISKIENTSPEGSGPNWVASFAAKPFWQGGYAVVQGFDFHNGREFKAPERMMFGGGVMVASDPSKFKGKTKTDFGVSWTKPDRYSKVAFAEGESPYDWKKMSKVHNPDGWDPQNTLVSIKKPDFGQLLWKESNKPSGYSLPDVYGNTELFKRVDETYAQHHEQDPYQTDQ